ncbi:MAG TPA: L,D-transpeptidase family protein, partial [Pseudolabrys sp.]|nr:L,D-transpeptidase family protein [Pseudolabrys sp.]
MRKSTIELLAGSALAIIVMQPSFATPTVRSVAPPPASINGYEHRRVVPRATVPVPQPRQDDAQDQQSEPPQQSRAQERVQERAPERPKLEAPAEVATPAPDPAPEPVAQSKGIDLKAALDKVLGASDSQISDKLRGFATAKHFDKLMPHQPERSAAEAFYKAHNYAPVWIKDGALTSRAKAAIVRMKNAAADGLDPADYAVPEFGALSSAEALAEGDVTLTNSVLEYARHLSTGRIAPTRVSAEVDYGNHTPDPASILRDVTTASDVNSTFESYNPPAPGFKALKNQLAALRSNASADVMPADRIPDGPMLRLGMKDSRVPMLREKLKARAPKNPADATYDKELAKAVYYFQKHAKLRADGNLDNKTLAALNGPAPMPTSKKIDTIVANMERWRWLPRDLGAEAIGDAYVILNIPDYTLKVMQHGQQIWTTKVVTGKPGIHATPLLTETMKYITVNPTWNVPPSIVYGEYLPALQQDPTVLQRMGLRVEQNRDGSVHISQPPGDGNALGRIRFNFPNKFLVYQHDTPDKYLFAKTERAYSH